MSKILEAFSTPKAICAAVTALLLLTWSVSIVSVSNEVSTVILTLDIASSTPSVSQLFFDIGRGFQEADSQTVNLNSNSLSEFQKLSFEIRIAATSLTCALIH